MKAADGAAGAGAAGPFLPGGISANKSFMIKTTAQSTAAEPSEEETRHSESRGKGQTSMKMAPRR